MKKIIGIIGIIGIILLGAGGVVHAQETETPTPTPTATATATPTDTPTPTATLTPWAFSMHDVITASSESVTTLANWLGFLIAFAVVIGVAVLIVSVIRSIVS